MSSKNILKTNIEIFFAKVSQKMLFHQYMKRKKRKKKKFKIFEKRKSRRTLAIMSLKFAYKQTDRQTDISVIYYKTSGPRPLSRPGWLSGPTNSGQ